MKANKSQYEKGNLTFYYDFDGYDEVEIIDIFCGKVNVWDDMTTACELSGGHFDDFLVKISDQILEDILDPAE